MLFHEDENFYRPHTTPTVTLSYSLSTFTKIYQNLNPKVSSITIQKKVNLTCLPKKRKFNRITKSKNT